MKMLNLEKAKGKSYWSLAVTQATALAYVLLALSNKGQQSFNMYIQES